MLSRPSRFARLRRRAFLGILNSCLPWKLPQRFGRARISSGEEGAREAGGPTGLRDRGERILALGGGRAGGALAQRVSWRSGSPLARISRLTDIHRDPSCPIICPICALSSSQSSILSSHSCANRKMQTAETLSSPWSPRPKRASRIRRAPLSLALPWAGSFGMGGASTTSARPRTSRSALMMNAARPLSPVSSSEGSRGHPMRRRKMSKTRDDCPTCAAPVSSHMNTLEALRKVPTTMLWSRLARTRASWKEVETRVWRSSWRPRASASTRVLSRKTRNSRGEMSPLLSVSISPKMASTLSSVSSMSRLPHMTDMICLSSDLSMVPLPSVSTMSKAASMELRSSSPVTESAGSGFGRLSRRWLVIERGFARRFREFRDCEWGPRRWRAADSGAESAGDLSVQLRRWWRTGLAAGLWGERASAVGQLERLPWR
mmetsp:Transcript_32007/g.81470  ORF Transcript_32007/g.81470 Transcript_32007/m.81470 type:complete len:433 (-) Transcript_32007:369-1667(-)